MSGVEAAPRRLHPASLVSRSFQILPQMLAGGAGYAAVIQREGLGRILMFAAVAAGLGFIVALLSWWRFRYAIGAGEIVIESGIFHRQRRVIPFDRVQDIAVERRLLARLLGTAKVKIETGGSAADEGSLDMIGLADAVTLRDHIRRWHGSAAPAAIDDSPQATGDEPVLFAMDLPRVLHAGLFNFSLVFLAVLFAAFQYLVDFGLLRLEDWINPERAGEAGSYFSIPATIVLVVVLLTLGVIAGVSGTLAREYGFRLTRALAGFRRRRGLFTLSEAVIPLRRMQVALIESGPVTRRLGWHSLSFQTLGADRKQGGVQAAAPFARIAEIEPLLAEAHFPDLPPRADFHSLPRRALLRRALPWLLLAALPALAAFLIDPRAGFGAIALLLLALGAILRWRKHAWAVGDRAFTVASGFLTRRTWIVPFEKTQSIGVYQGPIQRWLSLATLCVDTAGAVPLRTADIIDMDRDEAERLAAQLLNLFHRERARLKGIG